MKKQMKWGLATLILLLGIAAVFLLTDKDTETKPKNVLGQQTKDMLKQGAPLPQQAETPDPVRKPPPPGETKESGYWHGDHWYRHDEARTDDVIPVRQVTAAQRAEWEKYWKDQGLDPPPDGHGYEWDENGNISLYEYNKPTFEIKWSEHLVPGQDFHKLSVDEWKRYLVLEHIVSGTVHVLKGEQLTAVINGAPIPKVVYPGGVVELAREQMSDLEQLASAKKPKISTTVTWSRDVTPEDEANMNQQIRALLDSSTPPDRQWVEWGDDLLEKIIRELKDEVEKRR